MKLSLTKETVRKLAVKSAVRTGANVNGGGKVFGDGDLLKSAGECLQKIGEGGAASGGAGGGSCNPFHFDLGGDPAKGLNFNNGGG